MLPGLNLPGLEAITGGNAGPSSAGGGSSGNSTGTDVFNFTTGGGKGSTTGYQPTTGHLVIGGVVVLGAIWLWRK
ncbi:hypothetical protein [Microbulbifer taiwanensis]|uniref:LPXTG cell wall anchor domain-containing protein n=1 Tax=Microbulbifer taiwanensis TaxID=986746 RepID=A0ABW1YGJ9_9GAMM|nr:hypothetical protein [Microbulbifer taiwanensis]